MRRPTVTLLAAVAGLAGCGEGQDQPGVPPPATTGVVAPPPAKPATTAATVPALTVPSKPKPKPGPRTRAGYLARLDELAAKLGPAIDEAAQTGDSTPIARIDEAVQRTTKRWLADGNAASPAAATLAAAIATARTNVESSLLAPESRRQVQVARDALAAERAAG